MEQNQQLGMAEWSGKPAFPANDDELAGAAGGSTCDPAVRPNATTRDFCAEGGIDKLCTSPSVKPVWSFFFRFGRLLFWNAHISIFVNGQSAVR